MPEDGPVADPATFLDPSARHVVAAGRLQPEKRFDSLIRAFGLIEAKCPGWKLLILGDGLLRESLAALAASLGLADRVILPGRVARPRAVFRQCDIYALSSESEGFALVLVEAMSSGLPVVSFDCDFGPREIIVHNETGLLIPPDDVPALSEGILRLINDGDLRRRMGALAIEEARRFESPEILAQWQTLLASLASHDKSCGAHV
jgi:glycosyltransferase involved in cell wall biosynthesis